MPSENCNKSDLFKRLNLRDFRNNEPQSNLSYEVPAYFVIVLATVFLIVFIYASFISAFLPDFGVPVLDNLKNDQYYIYLLPTMILPTYIIIYLNWLSIKMFVHN